MSQTFDLPDEFSSAGEQPGAPVRDGTVHHLGTSALFTVVSVVLFGLIYPALMTGIALVAFPSQANGSPFTAGGKVVGSDIVGQAFAQARYFHGRPSAAGKNGYDPTATGGTNLGPTSRKLIDATRATLAALRKENARATDPVPIDLITSSASGIDPDISPEAALYQVPRVAASRHLDVSQVRALVQRLAHPRELGFLGEPRVSVLELNVALDALK